MGKIRVTDEMEWVETTGWTVDEAKNRALEALGIGEEDAEFVVLAEGSRRWFGLIRSEARIRARVRPIRPRPKIERRDRRHRRSERKSEKGATDE